MVLRGEGLGCSVGPQEPFLISDLSGDRAGGNGTNGVEELLWKGPLGGGGTHLPWAVPPGTQLLAVSSYEGVNP